MERCVGKMSCRAIPSMSIFSSMTLLIVVKSRTKKDEDHRHSKNEDVW